MLVGAVAVHAHTPQGATQCPTALITMHNKILNLTFLQHRCHQEGQDSPACRANQAALQRLTAQREQRCRGTKLPQGYCGCP